MTQSQLPPDDGQRYLALKTVMLPRDTNPHGTIFGGVILSYIDLAGAVERSTKSAAGTGRTNCWLPWR